jgi:hypothetical protein
MCPDCQVSFFFGTMAGVALMLIGAIGIREQERREMEIRGTRDEGRGTEVQNADQKAN